MLKRTIALLKSLNKHWFAFTFLVISLGVILIIFIKVYVHKDFLMSLPEDCESDFNTCAEIDEELIPTRFLLSEENYLIQNCNDQNFDLCLEKCILDKMCVLETEETIH